MRPGTLSYAVHNKSLDASRDCVSFIKALFSHVVATTARAPELNRWVANPFHPN